MPENFSFTVIFKDSLKVVAKVEGKRAFEGGAEVTARRLALADINPEKILETEAFLEKLTGFRVHIEQNN